MSAQGMHHACERPTLLQDNRILCWGHGQQPMPSTAGSACWKDSLQDGCPAHTPAGFAIASWQCLGYDGPVLGTVLGHQIPQLLILLRHRTRHGNDVWLHGLIPLQLALVGRKQLL